MQGDADIIGMLNEVLTGELTAVNQYFLHSKLCANWGYQRLAEHAHDESIGEMKDADAIIDRILYFDGVPNMMRMDPPVKLGEDPVEQHQLDLALEKGAVERLNKAIALCVARGDNGTRELLERILKGEEHAIDWLETQLHLIKEIGKERYLSEQL